MTGAIDMPAATFARLTPDDRRLVENVSDGLLRRGLVEQLDSVIRAALDAAYPIEPLDA
jgi:hypothetical protein